MITKSIILNLLFMSDYSKAQIEDAWENATIVNGYVSNVFRKDPCGAWIHHDSYGKETEYGWNIDHIIPKTLFNNNGYDLVALNRRAMHWENNASKSNDFPQYKSVVTSKGNLNIREEIDKHIRPDTITELMTKIQGLDNLIRNQKGSWIQIYGNALVEEWLFK